MRLSTTTSSARPVTARPPARPARRRLATVAGAALAALALTVLPTTPAAAQATMDAQVVGGEAFISNGYVEVGSRANGSFGSNSAPPTGYHPRPTYGLGFRSDRGKDGWTDGPSDGDFFIPGAPYEGWGIQIGDTGTPHYNDDNTNGVVGTWGGPVEDADGARATWASSADVDGQVSVTQVASVAADAQELDFTITLRNNSAAALTNIYYVRSVDADQCSVSDPPACDGDGDGDSDATTTTATHNKVQLQVGSGNSASAVSARQTDGSYIDLRTSAANSVAAISTGGWCERPPNLAGYFTTPPTVTGCLEVTTLGETNFADETIHLTIKTPTLAAGATATFTGSYVLSAAAAATEPQEIEIPTSLPSASKPGKAGGTVKLHATSSAGLPIVYTSLTLPVCTVSGSTVALVGTGTCTIRGTQAGAGAFEAADPVMISFPVVGPGQGGGNDGDLPITGSDTGRLVIAAGALLIAGLVLLVAFRRRLRWRLPTTP